MSSSQSTSSGVSEILASSNHTWDNISELAKSAPALTDTEFGLLSDLNTQFPHNPVSSSSYSSSSSAGPAGAATEVTLTNILGSGSLQQSRDQQRPRRRRQHGRVSRKELDERLKNAPKLPDLRFERGYRASIAVAEGCWWKILLITIRDQVTMPLIQGVLWNLTLVGVKSWRMSASASGNSWGSKYNAFLLYFFSFFFDLVNLVHNLLTIGY